ncbi:MAG: TIGR03790 family protein, partial [Phycisphaerae bacterium]
MVRALHVALVLAVLVVSATVATALDADEVFVVANGNVKDSRELAKYYAEQRDIPERNVLLVKTTANYEIPRDAFDEQLLTPIREALVKRKLMGRIKCIVLMWGVPVRVSGQNAPGELEKAYRDARTRAHYRLATAQIMMASVGKHFPDPQITSLTPLSKLFDPVTKKLTKLPKPDALLKDLQRVIEYKAKDLRLESNKKKRGIMARQLMALQLDVLGLEGLIEFIEDYDPDGAPETAKLKKQLDTARGKLDALGEIDSEKKAKIQIALTEIISGSWGAYALADKYA